MIINWQLDDAIAAPGYGAASPPNYTGAVGYLLTMTATSTLFVASAIRQAAKNTAASAVTMLATKTLTFARSVAPLLSFIGVLDGTRAAGSLIFAAVFHTMSAGTTRTAVKALDGVSAPSAITIGRRVLHALISGVTFTTDLIRTHPLSAVLLSASFHFAGTAARTAVLPFHAVSKSSAAQIVRTAGRNVSVALTLLGFLSRALFGGTHEPGSIRVTLASCVITIDVHLDH